MKTSDFRGFPSDEQELPPAEMPTISLLTMLRLGTFNMGLGILSLLTLGLLNRIMIDEMRVPAFAAIGAIAIHQFMAPARVWLGQLTDSKPLLGHHRTSYIWLGMGTMVLMLFAAVQVMWQLGATIAESGWGPEAYPWLVLFAGIFVIYGFGLCATSTPFTALLVDVSDEKTRSQVVGIGWSMLLVGIIMGAVLTKTVLDSLADVPSFLELQTSVNQLFVIALAVVCALTVFSTFGVEKKYSQLRQRSSARDREDSISLGQAIKVLTASRQTGIFFVFLLVLSLSLFTQDGVLEPYGGEVFAMSISETTGLNVFFGMGTLVGIIATGFLLVPSLGKKRVVKLGCTGAAVGLLLIAASGITADPKALQGALSFFGIFSGILTTGSIVLMLDLTAAETAGTFIGAWGLAQAIARGSAQILGGALLSLGKIASGIPSATEGVEIAGSRLLPAYSLVFITQAVGMMLAIALISRVNVREFQLSAKEAITAALESDLD